MISPFAKEKQIRVELKSGSRKLSKLSMSMKKIFLIFAICLLGNNAFASDNVLQAIQVDGVKDSYNIILKSDDVAEVKKTIQAPNKMTLVLNGIRASKTINTIYNNTSSVDSVVVEPNGDDSVKISVQAANVANAGVHFDSLKTPLGVLDKSQPQKKATDEVVLNDPVNSYSPVYPDDDEQDSGFSLSNLTGSSTIKNIFKNEKISWLVACVMFSLLVASGIKSIKGNDNDIKVGLSQSLKERDLDLYRSMGVGVQSHEPVAASPLQNVPGASYGLRAYQNGTRSPYISPEVQRPRPMAAPNTVAQPTTKTINPNPRTVQGPMQNQIQGATQANMQQTAVKTAPAMSKPKASNIDSIKFLESMTKIYEKNGRTDLAQGLKANMKKAKVNLA